MLRSRAAPAATFVTFLAVVIAVVLGGPAPAQAASGRPAVHPGILSYHFTYSTGMTWPQTAIQTPESVMTEVAAHFTDYFPFDSDCASLPDVGATCQLYYLGTSNPVEVVDRSPTSFTFISLPGHFEGENRYITFTFHKEGVDPFADMQMDADAWGPWTYGAWFSLETGQAEAFWREFANNVGAAYA